MGKLKAHYEELTESGRLDKDQDREILDKAYQDHLDEAPKDYAEKWWKPLDQSMTSDKPPYEDK